MAQLSKGSREAITHQALNRNDKGINDTVAESQLNSYRYQHDGALNYLLLTYVE